MTGTASDRPKSDLLDTVITAHGDLDRWRSLERLTAKVSAGGVLWGLKGQPGILDTRCSYLQAMSALVLLLGSRTAW